MLDVDVVSMGAEIRLLGSATLPRWASVGSMAMRRSSRLGGTGTLDGTAYVGASKATLLFSILPFGQFTFI